MVTMSEDIIAKIGRQFLSMVPVCDISVELDRLEECQQNLLDSTVLSPVAKEYPPSIKYQKSFLKSIISKLETNRLEVNECLYKQYLDLLKKSDNEEYCYKTYSLPNGQRITQKESLSLVTDGTTGLTVWQASKYLAEWLIENPSQVLNKCVLELGSGLGLLGLIVCAVCQPAQYTFTDHHPQVLDKLQNNINIPCNLLHSHNVRVQGLDWDHFSAQDVQDLKADIILAADLVYDPTILAPLVNVLHCLLTSPRAPYAIVACTLRTESTHNKFLRLLEDKKIDYHRMAPPINKWFQYDDNIPNIIYKLVCTSTVDLKKTLSEI